jgi:hypothetical protein
LNNDLKKYNEINLSKHEEFNWVEWKQIQQQGVYNNRFIGDIFVNYFDINNDGNEDGVFWWEPQYRSTYMSDIKYTTKEDGKLIENSTIAERLSGHGYFFNKEIGKADINNGFGVYHFTNSVQDVLYSKISHDYSRNIPISYRYIKRMGVGGFYYPEPYPLKINNTYFVAVFGVIEILADYKYGFSPYVYVMLNSGNIVALAKYNPDNTKSDVCILTRANPNTEKYFK